MGYALVGKVLSHWSNLPGNAHKVLILMANTGMDEDLVPVYFGGWERLAVSALGRHDWPADDDDSDEAKQTRRACFEIVRKAIRDLKLAGAIKVAKRGKHGAQARYTLHLDAANLWITSQSRTESVRNDARKACEKRTESVREAHGKSGAEEQEEQEEQGEESRSSPETTHLARDGHPSHPSYRNRRRLRLVREAADAAAAVRDIQRQRSLDQDAHPSNQPAPKEHTP